MVQAESRIVVFVKDIMRITGQSQRTSRRLFNKIRKEYNYTFISYIALDDFCAFTGLRHESVRPHLK